MDYSFILVIAIIMLSTKVLGLASEKVNMPQVVGALIAGLLLGPSCFGLIGESDFLVKTAEIGVIILMFTAGLDTDVQELKHTGLSAFIIATIGVIAIVIITHKMHEVEDLSDRVAVLRHGQFIGDMPTKNTNAQEMTNMMVGHAVELNIDRPDPVDPKPRVEVKNLTVRSIDGIVKLDDVSFTANSGEILGIAGISGCGQKELLEAIAGLQPTESGSVSYIKDDGSREELLGKDPLSIADLGVVLSFVPEDRLGMGLVANMDLGDNMMLRSFRKGKSFFTDRKSPRKLAESVVDELDVVTPGISTPVRRLSGGNVQKVLVGREIASAPTVLLTAYAVRGLDINSSYTIYDLINRQKQKGVAVIYVGEDLDVLLELCDRILVLCGGKVSGIVPGRGAKKREVGMMMTKLGGEKADE